jgi:hypothetical protein
MLWTNAEIRNMCSARNAKDGKMKDREQVTETK